MTKAIVFSYFGDGQTVPLEAHPTVLVSGLPDAGMTLLQTTLSGLLGSLAVQGNGPGGTVQQLDASIVEVEDDVEPGDTLDQVSLIFKKHV